VVVTRTKPRGAYPTTGLEVVVEILSEDDSYLYLKDKCREYQEWGFSHIVVWIRLIDQCPNGKMEHSPRFQALPELRLTGYGTN
jgi:hypothetical protein